MQIIFRVDPVSNPFKDLKIGDASAGPVIDAFLEGGIATIKESIINQIDRKAAIPGGEVETFNKP